MILDEIKNRFSVREYLDKDVSENDLMKSSRQQGLLRQPVITSHEIYSSKR